MTETNERKWIFLTPVRCPRCKGYRTFATHTDGERGIQYRRCRNSLCRSVRLSVKGIAQEPESVARGPCPGSRAPDPGLRDTSHESPVTAVESRVASDETPSYDCPHCPNSYKRKSGLTKHIKREHSSQNGEPNDA